ncbi:MAG: glutathione S-transferase [Salinisphaeraceae bacterium]|jgi:glutathione S-transferase|nr:glutathione S-transferase [Salinisphaeraceae bacterium]
MLTVHHLENSRSQRILWLLEEIGLDYAVERYERDPKTMLAPASLKKVHSLGRSPVITDGDEVIAETGAIIDYLIEDKSDGALSPERGTPAWRRYNHFLHYAEGSLMPLLVMKLITSVLGKKPTPLLFRPMGGLVGLGMQKQFIDPRIRQNLEYLDAQLGDADWFVENRLTGADIMLSFPLEASKARGGLAQFPRLIAYVDRFQALPGYQRALERGGPYAILGG